MTNEPERWSSLEEVSEHLGVSKDTIRNWIKKKLSPIVELENNTNSKYLKKMNG